MRGQCHDLYDWRRVEARPRMERQAAPGSHVVGVGAGLICGTHSLRRAGPVELRSIQVALGRVAWRCKEIQPAVLLVEPGDVDHVGVEARDERAVPAAPRHTVHVLPAIALARPQERSALVDPAHFLDHVDPCLRLIAKGARHLAGGGIGDQEIVLVLQPVQLLDRERAAVEPLQARKIRIPRIARGPHPRRLAARGADDPDAHGGIRGPGLGVRDRRDRRVERGRVVDEREDPDAGRVELPVGDALAVGAPAEAVADAEFLFVDPVRRAVDGRLRPIFRQRHGAAVGEALDVDVVAADVGHARAVGRELGEHERRFRGIARRPS